MSLIPPLLMVLVLPLWVLAGLADWACHRRTRIELTGGLRESAFHWLMFLQMGLAVLAALFLEINAAVLVLGALLFLAHEFTTWLELRYVVGRRELRPLEQMVHSFLELLPLAGLLLLAVLFFQGQGGADPGPAWTLRLKPSPLPTGYLVAALCGVAGLNGLPLVEESWRCIRARRAAARVAL